MNITQPYLQVGGNYIQIYKYFHHYKDEIRQLYTFRPSIVNYVHMYAKQFFKYTFQISPFLQFFKLYSFKNFAPAVLFCLKDRILTTTEITNDMCYPSFLSKKSFSRIEKHVLLQWLREKSQLEEVITPSNKGDTNENFGRSSADQT
jgi:hypothetical protein